MRPISRIVLLALICGGIIQTASAARPAIAVQESRNPSCGTRSPGLLLLESGAPDGGLIVRTVIDGSELGRFDLPRVTATYSTTWPARALAVSGDALYLLDAENFSATRIDLAGRSAAQLSPNPIQFRGSAGERYMLLGSPSFDQAFLIDLELGVATSLTDLLAGGPGASAFISFAVVTPGDGHVVLWDGRHVFLVETADPSAARQVDSAAFAFAPDVSPDGDRIVYSQSDGPGTGSTVVLQPVDGGAPETLVERDRALVTLWIPGTESILIDARTEQGEAEGTVTVLDLKSGSEAELLEYAGSLTTVQFDAAGSHALLGVDRFGIGDWYAADLQSMTAQHLTQSAGGRALPGLYGDADWALLVPFETDDPAGSADAYRVVDLEAGRVIRLLARTPGSTYAVTPLLSQDGRFAIVIELRPDETILWLLDAREVRNHEIARATNLDAAFSPDGCHFAVTIADGRDVTTVIYAAADPAAGTLATYPGENLLIWLEPT